MTVIDNLVYKRHVERLDKVKFLENELVKKEKVILLLKQNLRKKPVHKSLKPLFSPVPSLSISLNSSPSDKETGLLEEHPSPLDVVYKIPLSYEKDEIKSLIAEIRHFTKNKNHSTALRLMEKLNFIIRIRDAAKLFLEDYYQGKAVFNEIIADIVKSGLEPHEKRYLKFRIEEVKIEKKMGEAGISL